MWAELHPYSSPPSGAPLDAHSEEPCVGGGHADDILDPLPRTFAMLLKLTGIFGAVDVSHRVHGLVGQFDQFRLVGQKLDPVSRLPGRRARTPCSTRS